MSVSGASTQTWNWKTQVFCVAHGHVRHASLDARARHDARARAQSEIENGEESVGPTQDRRTMSTVVTELRYCHRQYATFRLANEGLATHANGIHASFASALATA